MRSRNFEKEEEMITRRSFLLGSAAAAYEMGYGLHSLADSTRRQPNILLLITDQQSADAASYRIGRRYLYTPNIDELATTGTTFSRAYCSNPLCVPSRTSMFTGHYPTETGVVDNNGLGVRIDTKRYSFMGRIFRNAGYETAYFGKWHIACEEDRADVHGFQTMATTFNDDAAAVLDADDYLQRPHSKPFLLVTSFLNPHNICEWARGQELPLGSIGTPPPASQCPPLRFNHLPQKNEPDIVSLMRRSYQASPMFPVGNFDDGKWRQYEWAYYRLIEKVDAQIGAVLDALRKSPYAGNTLIVLLSDHGDCQGAHQWNQKTVLYEEANRVPFILNFPGVIGEAQSDRLLNTGIDLIPTLCDYAGVQVPEGMPGLSLRNAQYDPREYVVVSNKMVQGMPIDGQLHTPEGRMLRGQRYKYCAYSEGEQRESLVDLQDDPGEMVNLAGDVHYRKILKEHRSMLTAWCATTGDSFLVTSEN